MGFTWKNLPLIIWVVGAGLVLQTGMVEGEDKNYQALSLEDCQAIARKHNPVLSASRERVQELVADYQAARSKFFPRLLLLSYYDRQPPNRFAPGGSSATDLFKREGYSSVAGKQIVFDGLKTYFNTQAAKTGTQAQKQEVRRTADEVAFTVSEAFYRLIEAKENLKVAQEALQQRQEFARLTNAFFQSGKVTHLDSFRAQSQVSDAEQAVVEAQNVLTLAREILARTMGLQEQVQVDIRGRLPEKFVTAGEVNFLWQEALKTNPEIKRLDLEIAQSQTLIKAARGNYFPEVSLQAGSDVRHRDLGGTKPEWIAGVFMEYPFFEGGLTKAQVAKASSQSLQLLEKKRDRLNGLKVDLTGAWKDQENARQGVATTRQTMATNAEAKEAIDTNGDPLVYLSLPDAQEVLYQKDNEEIRNQRTRLSRSLARQNSLSSLVADKLLPSLQADTHLINAILVRLKPGVKRDEVARHIENWLYFSTYTTQQETQLMLKGRLAGMTKQLLLFRILLMIISVVIISLVIYTFTMEKIRAIAVMKLIGAPNRVIVRLVMEQSLLLTISAFIFALVLINQTYHLFPKTILLVPEDEIITFIVVLFGGILASFLGLLQALKTQPAMALGGQ